jgi:hypothetical protein
MKIKIEIETEDRKSVVEAEGETWHEMFPVFLDAFRGAGYVIDDECKVYLPGELVETLMTKFSTNDNGHLLFDSDLK